MEFASLIDTQRVLLDVNADCPKAVFRCVSDLLSPISGIPARDIADALTKRERIGSTAVGNGVAIPHARIDGIESAQAFFLRLSKPIDMDAMDDKPVDLMFVLLVPDGEDNDHLRVLSRISRVLRDESNLDALRSGEGAAAIVALFDQP